MFYKNVFAFIFFVIIFYAHHFSMAPAENVSDDILDKLDIIVTFIIDDKNLPELRKGYPLIITKQYELTK